MALLLALTGNWWTFAGGQSMGGPYRPATRTSDNVGALRVEFSGPATATMTLPDGRRIPLVRQAIDDAAHPALLMVDTISSLASIDYRHDEWGVDVTVSGSQKGLMLPPGLSFNAVSEKAMIRTKRTSSARRIGVSSQYGLTWKKRTMLYDGMA